MKEFLKKYILIISILVFLLITLINISVAPLWRDEAFSALVATNDWGKIIEIASKDTQPPLHLFLLHISYLIAGKGEFALRIWSLLGGLLTLIFSFKLAGKLFKDDWSKILIAPLIVFNPILYNYSLEARPYALFTGLFVGVIYFALSYGQSKKKKDFIILFLLSLIGLYLHNLFVVCVFIVFILLFVLRLKDFKDWKNLKLLFKNTKDIFLLGILIVAIYLPWLLTFLSQLGMVSSGGFWLQFEYLKSLTGVLAMGFAGEYYYNQNEPIFYVVVISVILGIAGLFFGWFKELLVSKKSVPLLIISSFIPLLLIYLISFKTPFMYVRYMIFIIPILLISIVKGFEKIKILTIAFLISSIIVTSSTLIFKPNLKEDYKDAIAKIQYDKNSDVIFHKNALPVFGFRYYSDLPSYIFNKPEDIKYFEGKAALVDSDYWKGNIQNIKRVWVLNLWQDNEFDQKIKDLGFVKVSEEKFDGDLYLYLYTR
jgi:4-amino-4-deoxy-L-arabinose transferase-like glycosyltransferase